ncbi:MAG: signal peptide peptidase SppA [Candidatus Micrarchaeia archaeon]
MKLRFLGVLLAVLFIGVATLLVISTATEGKTSILSKCVALIELKGEISTSSSNAFGQATASVEAISQQLKEAEENPQMTSIVLLVNSPGGSAVASKELHDEVKSVKKPIIAYFSESAASGGYYVAAASNYIVANPNTITGSIGARASILNYEGLFGKVGLKEEAFKSGELKDIGAGYRNLTDKERQLLDEMVMETFENFEKDVREARKGKLTAFFEEVLDGRILTAKNALKAGLIDEIGTRKKAVEKAASLANSASTQICKMETPRSLSELLSSLSSNAANTFALQIQKQLTQPSITQVRMEYS